MRYLFICLTSFIIYSASAQNFTLEDSLRGSITSERAWWDLNYYHLEVQVFPETKSIQGKNTIRYEVLEPMNIIQIDLQPPLKITRVIQDGVELTWESTINAHFIKLTKDQKKGDENLIEVYYEGNPRPAIRAPWDGGFSWKKSKDGSHFIATSCQGLGASVWWPCKDHMYDEVDSMLISVTVPEDLADVSNGRLRKVDHDKDNKTRTFHWAVSNPINNYGVNLNIGNYVSWTEVYQGEKGDLDITYWALKEDEQLARKQYKDVIRMLDAFEYWFGPYPFYEDGYQLVQAPYLGMEHQSSVTYGNKFKQGYLGRDLSNTGWGLKFDFIIIHESGHEWFANNITFKDMADMWVHEGFTNYSESLFLDYHYGKQAGLEYVRGTRAGIENRKPMIGYYNVNYEGYPGDVYHKGANILNMIRRITDDDEKWRGMFRSMNKEFYHKTVTSKDIEGFISNYLGRDHADLFDQFLRDNRVPALEYYFSGGKFYYRFSNCLSDFHMPVDVKLGDSFMRIEVSTGWNNLEVQAESMEVDADYYIGTFKIR
jgi:aminopeptidase N